MNLQSFFQINPKAAIAFSGGADSAFLLYSAIKYGAKVKAYYIKSAFQPQFELEDAIRLAAFLGADMTVLEVDILKCDTVASNPADRCYHCKKEMFYKLKEAAAADGFSLILDGTNASDDADDRPGMRALKELSIRSPLRECGLTKAEIRNRSKQAGLFTWDKPSYACLATRVPTGTPITNELLKKTEAAERYLATLGLRDFRVRLIGDSAKIQVPQAYFTTVLHNRLQIVAELKKYYNEVLLDMEVRQ